ncbi:hypothetical protein [Planctomicrobium sp. SH527]|uniref:hypothetical protein n=1 Tax=Planctomicrobium sp. SH527 TaxID=3448123 RepID=UPI003F5C6D54
MQIRRIDNEPHLQAQPNATPRAHAESQGNDGVSQTRQQAGNSALRTEADAQLTTLVERLKTHINVREDVVAAAKEKLAAGSFSTRASAEQLAGSNLRLNYF